MNIKSSYPNKYFMSKHQRFRNDGDVCVCACDCDALVNMIDGLRRGDMCHCCKMGDHQEPIYKDYVTIFHLPEAVCDSCLQAFDDKMIAIQHCQKFGHVLK
jgi:hypothetical protein